MTADCRWSLDPEKLSHLLWEVGCQGDRFRANLQPWSINFCPWCGGKIDTPEEKINDL